MLSVAFQGGLKLTSPCKHVRISSAFVR